LQVYHGHGIAGRQLARSGGFFRNTTKVLRVFTANGATRFFWRRRLKSARFSVLLSNPIRKMFFADPAAPHSALHCTTPLYDAKLCMRTEETSGETDLSQLAHYGERDFCLLAFDFLAESSYRNRADRWLKQGTDRRKYKNVIRSDGYRRAELLGSHPCRA
jgi:hypothetical protein